VSDFHEAIGQDMEERTPDKLRDMQGHELGRMVVVAVSISKSDTIFF